MNMRKVASGMKILSLQWIGYVPSQVIRKLIYTWVFGMQLRGGVTVYGKCEFRKPEHLVIAEGTIVGEGCMLDSRRGIEIGSNVNISSGVWIWTLHHNVQSPDFAMVGDKVTIGDRAWLCSRCTILPGVHIGEGAVIASGAVVTKNVAAFTVVGGIPAKEIGKRTEGLNYQLARSPIPFI
jgi:UDP-3-O-[3-hydroxymyristoyl] glucosamine N-acyltransferase